MIGKTLAHYEIQASLGAGGMGEVYLAHDGRLDRRVALKFLPQAFARDDDRIARFQREAKVLASLNHANIAALYGFEQVEATHFLVMELVEGETLADLIARGPIPPEQALRIGLQISEAMETAHEKGIIHRDLKPANVKITSEGKVKVLDFGLAKAIEGSPANTQLSNSPTLSLAATSAGVILGTAAYMSPEQANGFTADARSDIFSLGCVLFEMLSGRQSFQGHTVSEVLASVLAREPDFNLIPGNLNPRIHSLLRRCLEKNPKRRWQAIGDVRVELEGILSDSADLFVTSEAGVGEKPFWKRAIPAIVSAIVFSALAGIAGWNLKPAPSAAVVKYPFTLPDGQQFTNTGRQVLAISPDGKKFVYVANRALYLKSLSELQAVAIPGTENPAGVLNPVFSPDGQSIAFSSGSDQIIKRVAIGGGAPVTICAAGGFLYGMSWSDDDQILFGLGSKGIMRCSASGGTPETIVSVNENEVAHGPQLLPGGNDVLLTLGSGQIPALTGERWSKSKIIVQSLKSGQRTVLVDGGADGRYVPTGHLIYELNGVLLAVPFDVKHLRKTGGPVSVVEGVRHADIGSTGSAQFSFSANGSLVYVPGIATSGLSQNTLALVDRNGTVKSLAAPPGPYSNPRISPDGKQVVFGIDDGKEQFVATFDLSGASSIRRLTFGGSNRQPFWSADGQRILYGSDRDGGGLDWQRIDGTGTERLIKLENGTGDVAQGWSSDRQKLLFAVVGADRIAGAKLFTYSVQDKKTEPLNIVVNADVALSRDGRWLAYQAADSAGLNQIYVEPYPATGAKFQIRSTTGGGAGTNHHPLWSADGKELFLVNNQRLYSIKIQTQPTFADSPAAPLNITGFSQGTAALRNYDITPDGKQFLFILPPGRGTSESRTPVQIQVVLNWFEELKQRSRMK